MLVRVLSVRFRRASVGHSSLKSSQSVSWSDKSVIKFVVCGLCASALSYPVTSTKKFFKVKSINIVAKRSLNPYS